MAASGAMRDVQNPRKKGVYEQSRLNAASVCMGQN